MKAPGDAARSMTQQVLSFSVAETDYGLPTKLTCVLVIEALVEGEPLTFGVLADAVNAVVDLADDQVEPPPSFGPHVNVDYLVGMGKLDQRFVLLLDIDRVLSAPETDVPAQLAAAVMGERSAPAPDAGAAEG